MTVRLTQPPRSLARTPEELAWLEQLARIVNTLISSGGTELGEPLGDAGRPTTLLYPGRFYFDGQPDMGADGGGMPIWRSSDNSEWLDAIGSIV